VLTLSMLMTTAADEREILRLATSAMPSLAHCRLEGVHIDEAWRVGAAGKAAGGVPLGPQLAALEGREGTVDIPGRPWAWAFPLASPAELIGHVVVSADDAPPEPQRFLLAMLVQLAGVAVANARLHERERALTNQLQVTNRSLERSTAAAEQARSDAQRSLDIHRLLTAVATAAEGPAGIAHAVHQLTSLPVAVEDRHGSLLAWAGPGEPVPYARSPAGSRQRLLRRAVAAGRPVRHRGRLWSAARSGGEVFGLVALVDASCTARPLDEVVLEHAATVLTLELARLRVVAEAELRVRRDLVEQLLSGERPDDATARAHSFGYDLSQPHRVAMFVTARDSYGKDALLHAVRRGARDAGAGSLVVSRPNGVVLLCAGTHDWDRLRVAVEAELGTPGQCRMGLGGVCLHPSDYERSFREARLALRLQEESSGPPSVTSFEDLGVYRLFSQVGDLSTVEAFARRWLGLLVDHDVARRGELVRTLSAYVECGGSYEATAAALNVHRSTLRYRLGRIKDLSGLDLNDPDTRFNVQLATRAWSTVGAVRRQ
jgi:sugar diacid utilization regulator